MRFSPHARLFYGKCTSRVSKEILCSNKILKIEMPMFAITYIMEKWSTKKEFQTFYYQQLRKIYKFVNRVSMPHASIEFKDIEKMPAVWLNSTWSHGFSVQYSLRCNNSSCVRCRFDLLDIFISVSSFISFYFQKF